MTTQEIIEVIKGLSVLELNDLVKACEEEFGVSAAAPVAVAGAAAGAAAECTAAGSAAGFASRERSRGCGCSWFLDLQLWCGFFGEILSGVWCIASGGGQLDLFLRYGE